MSLSPVEYLRHILDGVKYLEEQSIDLSKEAFLESETLKRAFVRSLEIIGEATKHLPRELCDQYPNVQWRALVVLPGFFWLSRKRSSIMRLPNMDNEHWPRLPMDEWQDTYETLHLWSQIVGKIRLSHMPWINHSWHVPLYVTSQGLTTSLIPYGTRAFTIDFDINDHQLRITTSEGERRAFALEPMSMADFYGRIVRTLDDMGIETRIWPMPVEIPGSVQTFPEDKEHAAYDPESVQRFWRALVQIHRVFTDFRARFIGKVSPVHFFWGSFDLAVTRFSGRTAPKHPGGAPNLADRVMEEAYSHELSSAGFWPGAGLGEAAFYSYAYPEPDGFSAYSIQPEAAYYQKDLREFILPYDAVRTAGNPDETLLSFLQTTYEAAANLGNWDRAALERGTMPRRT